VTSRLGTGKSFKLFYSVDLSLDGGCGWLLQFRGSSDFPDKKSYSSG
jgi:hypothetical protein